METLYPVDLWNEKSGVSFIAKHGRISVSWALAVSTNITMMIKRETTMKILVSACLLGENCKYNGGNNYNPFVVAYVAGKDVLPICPEMMAGMGCPRNPIEIVDGVQTDCDGKNVDAPIRETVAQIMEQICQEKIECAILQSRSPTCGVNQIYDGSFSGKLISDSGVFAKCLIDAGYRVIDAEDISKMSE